MMNSSMQSDMDDTEKFAIRDNETYIYEGKEASLFADFAIKLVGEVHQPEQLCGSIREGKWLASINGYIFGEKASRIITLKASEFDSKKQLLEAVRRGFPGSSLSFAPGIKTDDVQEYWRWLVSQYDKDSAIKVFETQHLGLQDSNYWIVNEETHLLKNSILERGARQYALSRDLHNVSTTVQKELLSLERLTDTTKRLLDASVFFLSNSSKFKLVTSFCLSRLLRSSSETWGESNIGLIYSSAKNCGKSQSLRILSKLQGVPSGHHQLLLSGGNQNTSGASAKILMDILSKTSMVVMIDDPLISRNLGEFLNQIQGGLFQGSATSGLHIPKGSVLVSTNDEEVARIEGRVQRFDYVRDEGFRVNNFMEKQIMELANDNKGLLVAWCMRFEAVWQEQVDETVPLLQNALQKAFPREQLRWVKGQAFTLCAYAMLHATANKKCHLANVLEEMQLERKAFQPPILARFQVSVFNKLVTEEDGKQAHTWINPFCSANALNGERLPAFAFSKETLNLLGPEVTNQELEDELKRHIQPKSVSQPCCFALNGEAELSSLRKKKTGDGKTISRRAFKIPTQLLNPLFITWIQYALGIRDNKPDKNLEEGDVMAHEMETTLALDDLECAENTIYQRVKDFIEEQKQCQGNQTQLEQQGTHTIQEAVESMSPLSKHTYRNWTPNRKRAFEMGVAAANKYQENKRGTLPTFKDIATSPISNATKDNTRKELFPEGTAGIIRSQRNPKVPKRVNLNACPCGKKFVGKKATQDWVKCDDCKQWFHKECAGIKELPGDQCDWFCKNCCT